MAYFTYKMYNDDVMYNGNNYIDDNDGWTRIMLVQKNAITYIYIYSQKEEKESQEKEYNTKLFDSPTDDDY